MVMDKLGNSIIDIYEMMGSKMKKIDVLKIGLELFDLIEKLHANGIVHQDIKLDNILFSQMF